MRILQVISTLNPEYGGPVEGLKQMIIELNIWMTKHPELYPHYQ